MGRPRAWPALVIRAGAIGDPPDAEELLAALLDDWTPLTIEDLAERPLPPGGLWDPTFPPIPDPPPTPLHWRVFFSDTKARDAARLAIAESLPRLTTTPVEVADDDWAARSQASLTAVRAGRFIVAPPWDVPAALDANDTLVVIEPSMGFGTGHHETTRLCLRLLSELNVNGCDVLDLGTGSGVLAMAAALRGAKSVVGLDVDPDAIASAETSALLNALPPTVTFRVADFRTARPPAFAEGFGVASQDLKPSGSQDFQSEPVAVADVVLANLTAGMLKTTAARLGALVRPDGTLIVSGFDHTEVDAVICAFGGFDVVDRVTEESWVALRLVR